MTKETEVVRKEMVIQDQPRTFDAFGLEFNHIDRMKNLNSRRSMLNLRR